MAIPFIDPLLAQSDGLQMKQTMALNGGYDHATIDSRRAEDDATCIARGGHYIVACTSTCDRGQDLDPSNFRA